MTIREHIAQAVPTFQSRAHGQCPKTWIGPMNVLPFEQQIAVISALTEGCSIRSTERLTGVHRDTIMRLAARVGFGAIKFHDRTVHSLQVPRLELDEAWSFVAKNSAR